MVVDTSAWVAVALGEDDAERYAKALSDAFARSEPVYLPASVIVEAGIVLDLRGAGRAFDQLIELAQPVVVAIDSRIAGIARAAYSVFGKGIHRAKLNFGDCLSYAVCIHLGETLLFKGDDFIHTGVARVL